jgi:hypothetical protein
MADTPIPETPAPDTLLARIRREILNRVPEDYRSLVEMVLAIAALAATFYGGTCCKGH